MVIKYLETAKPSNLRLTNSLFISENVGRQGKAYLILMLHIPLSTLVKRSGVTSAQSWKAFANSRSMT